MVVVEEPSLSVGDPVEEVSEESEVVSEPVGVVGVVTVVVSETVTVTDGVLVVAVSVLVVSPGRSVMLPMTVVVAVVRVESAVPKVGIVSMAAQAEAAADWAATISLVSQLLVKHSRPWAVMRSMLRQAQAKSVALEQPTSGRICAIQLSWVGVSDGQGSLPGEVNVQRTGGHQRGPGRQRSRQRRGRRRRTSW